MKNDKTISVLNNLIEICKDGQEGFRQASEAVKDTHLKTIFGQFSQQRAQFAGELQQEVMRLGGDPEKSGTLSGSMHRGWINLKSAITGGSEPSIISECERGEDSAKDEYRKALEENKLPADLRDVVQRQYTQVKAAHDQIRSLEVKTHH